MITNIKYDINEDKKFENTSFFGRLFQRYCTPTRAKLLAKATKRIEKELDLVKFMKRMRLLLGGTLGRLTP